MNTYDDASLILYPSGYKASKLYSLKPTDGSGDLDVVRATTATRVNSDGLIEEVAINVPRIDYTGGGCGKLLLEPQRTNVCLWSEQINNAGWGLTNAPTITTNIATAPDGFGGADGIQDTTGGTFKRIRQATSVSANSTNTASVFVKKETTQTNFGGLSLTYTGGTVKFAYGIINPIAGTIVVASDSVIGATSTKAEDYGNWWRFSLTATDNGSNTTLEIAYYATISTNGTSTGVGTGSVRTVWGFQLEIGVTYATSYINTLGAQVTRSADAASKTGISSLIGQTEGTLFAQFTYNGVENSGEFERIIAIGDGTANNRIVALIRNNTSQLNLVSTNGGVAQVSTGAITGTSAIGNHKLAFAYKSNDYVCYLDGVQVFEQASGSVPAVGNFYLGRNEISDSQQLGGTINQSLLFPTRLTNLELETLTTP